MPIPTASLRRLACWSLLVVLSAGCSETRQIQTAPPQAGVPLQTDTSAAQPRALLTVMVETGETTLPPEIRSMRFRVNELALLGPGGTWTSYQAEQNLLEIVRGQPTRKTVLSAQVPPAAYDSLAIELSDIYVRYDANAGGPLAVPRGTPIHIPLTTYVAVGRPKTVRLVFEAGASLSRTADCRWFFVPFFEPIVE